MAKHKTSELEGALLDAAVAKAEGRFEVKITIAGPRLYARTGDPDYEPGEGVHYLPSTLWEHGGPIIEQERIALMPAAPGEAGWIACSCCAGLQYFTADAFGGSPLIAAMRAFVAVALGEEVELP